MRNNSMKKIRIWTSGSGGDIKAISYLDLWRPIRSVERNCLYFFGRRYHEEQFCEIILNFDQWSRR